MPTRLHRQLALLCLASAASAVVCSLVADPLPRGDRRLGIDVTEGATGDYDASFQVALGAGMEVTPLSIGWDTLEPSPGVFDTTLLDIIDVYFPAFDTQVMLAITLIDTNQIRVPADLVGLAFDDPRVIQRFEALLDVVLSRLGNTRLAGLAIGNEIDILLGDDAVAWQAWRAFFAETAAHARSLRAGLEVGTKTTFFGLIGEARHQVLTTQALADHVYLTYYPLDDTFQVRPTAEVGGDLRTMVESFPGRPVSLLEAGYPAGAENGSSPAAQAAFVASMFAAWDEHAATVEMISFSWLNDRSSEEVAAFLEYYGIDDPAFASYLATLGLRDELGVPKVGLGALRREAAARGWEVADVGEPCRPDETGACLVGDRFRVSVEWRDGVDEGVGRVALASDDSAIFWFFEAANWEMLVKVLDGCALNDHFWVFAAATTDVGFTLRVIDTATGAERSWSQPLGQPAAAINTTDAFATCP